MFKTKKIKTILLDSTFIKIEEKSGDIIEIEIDDIKKVHLNITKTKLYISVFYFITLLIITIISYLNTIILPIFILATLLVFLNKKILRYKIYNLKIEFKENEIYVVPIPT